MLQVKPEMQTSNEKRTLSAERICEVNRMERIPTEQRLFVVQVVFLKFASHVSESVSKG